MMPGHLKSATLAVLLDEPAAPEQLPTEVPPERLKVLTISMRQAPPLLDSVAPPETLRADLGA